jgi:hypothetical protein
MENMKNKECFECGKLATEDHHVIPQSLGGTRTVPLCGSCHNLAHGDHHTRRDDHKELTKAGIARALARGQKFGSHLIGEETAARGRAAAVMKISEDALSFAKSIISIILPLKNSGMSLNGIAAELNLKGIKTARGGKWYAKTVANVFDILDVPFRVEVS